MRNWWRWEYTTPQAYGAAPVKHKVPDPGARKTTIATRCTYEEALRICEEYAKTHKPGPLSRKAEFTEEG